MILGDGTGRRFGEFSGVPDLPPSRVLWRSDLYRLLTDCAASQSVAVESGRRLVGVEEGPTSITALFADGGVAQGDILIGTDGISSTVRALIDPAAPLAQYVGFIGFGGLSSATCANTRADAMYFVFGKRAFMGHWSHPDGGTIWFSNLPHAKPLTMAE